MQITGIIMAGGKSHRMGRDKTFLQIEGETLLTRAVKFCGSFCNEIFISSSNPEHKVEGIKRIPDEIKNCGPLAGIYSSLKKTTNDWNFILSVDAVFAEKELVFEMMKETDNFDAVVPYHDGRKEPLIAFYHREMVTTILQQLEKKNYRMTDFLEMVNVKWFDAQNWINQNPRIFHNLNRPEDLAGIK